MVHDVSKSDKCYDKHKQHQMVQSLGYLAFHVNLARAPLRPGFLRSLLLGSLVNRPAGREKDREGH